MADFNGNYLVIRSTTEVAGTERTLKAIIEANTSLTINGDLAAAITIQNLSAGDLKVGHLADLSTHYILIESGVTRQLVPADYRIPLSAIYVDVATTNNPFSVEVVFE